ncbi:hypothetical protein PHMEG_00016107 [Phytophthora megakarya]|uniref:Uncharacterized protein n=1 Tax=Phytophthora megakarya TaxID=4795 RepID=A0A225VZT0_9STRA|nr:hypothetical protein PHMEG_00016107 [Phytophthora megakarya]
MDSPKQKLVVSENINVNQRNNTLRSQVHCQGREDEDIPLMPTKFKLYQRKHICTHSWRERERGNGTHTVHKLRFLAKLAQGNGGQWSIRLARKDYRHNHAISTDVYRSYPGIRQVPGNSPLMPGIELLVKAQAGNSRIYDYIRDNSTHRVTMEDVQNLVNRIRNSGTHFYNHCCNVQMSNLFVLSV